MKRTVVLFIIALLMLVSLSLPRQAEALANATYHALECNRLTVTGTSSAPYATIQAYTIRLGTSHFTTVPVVNGQFTASVTYPQQELGTVMRISVWGTLNPFNNIYDPGYWDGQVYFEAREACGPQPFAGPPLPSGYVMRTITCDVAVFDAPGGNPIGSNALKAGQTFYVSTTSSKAANGSQWVQVFVSSTINPWIPARCVQGGVGPGN